MFTIAWDVDDVLNSLMYSWLSKEKYSQFHSINYEDIKKNPPHHILGISLNKYKESLDKFRLSENFINMEPKEEIITWFRTYGHLARHIALTAVPLKAAHVSSTWVLQHFGKWIRNFCFIPSKREGVELPLYDKSKASFLKWIEKIDILIEDNPENIEEANMVGVKTITISQPWNQSNQTLKESLDELNKLLGI